MTLYQASYLVLLTTISLPAYRHEVQGMFTYTDQALKDQVHHMPYSYEPQPSNQFSGFLNITDTKNIHYVYFESESNPETDDLFFWTNGGPGCSGLLGLFTEFGPWRPTNNGSLMLNPFRWTKKASFVFLEQPVGVGFSYTTDPQEMLGFNDYQASKDNLLAIKTFFQRFPEAKNRNFYLSSESYGGHYIPQLTLEILNDDDDEGLEPSTTPSPEDLDPNPEDLDPRSEESARVTGQQLRRRFGGFLLGNPFTSYASGSIAMAHVLWGLQLVPRSGWHDFLQHDCADFTNTAYDFVDKKPHCLEILDDLFAVTQLLNPYALEYPICTKTAKRRKSQNSDSTQSQESQEPTENGSNSFDNSEDNIPGIRQGQGGSLLTRSRSAVSHYLQQKQNKDKNQEASIYISTDPYSTQEVPKEENLNPFPKPNNPESKTQKPIDPWTSLPRRGLVTAPVEPEINPLLKYDPCVEEYTKAYLNKLEVQEALHVIKPQTGKGIQLTHWEECSDEVNLRWNTADVLADTTNLFSIIMSHPRKRNKRFEPKGKKTNLMESVRNSIRIQEDKKEPSSDEINYAFKMLIYSGDADGVCATVGTQNWIFKIPEITPINLFKPWHFDHPRYGLQPGGFLTQFTGFFAFMTIHHAGHEAPAYQPRKAQTMFEGFIDNSIFEPLKVNSTKPLTHVHLEESIYSEKSKNNPHFWVLMCFSVLGAGFFVYRKISRRNRDMFIEIK